MKVRKEDVENWPFPVDFVLIKKTIGNGVIVRIENKTYAINGAAIGIGAEPLPEELWLNNPKIPGTKITMRDVIKWGLDYA